MSELFMSLALPCLVLAGIGLCLCPLGIRFVASLGGTLFFLCLMLSDFWAPLSLLALTFVSWLGKVAMSLVLLLLFIRFLRWISGRPY